MSSTTPDATASIRQFTADLYARVATTPGNVVLSPYSAAIALAMTLAGARGETAEQISRVLHTPVDDAISSAGAIGGLGPELSSAGRTDADVILDVANSVWAQQGLSWDQQFLSALETGFKVSLQQVDFDVDSHGAARRINAWVAEQTHNKITELFSPEMIDELTRLVLVNAAYFKAAWDQPFRDPTSDRRFTIADGTAVQVPTMSQTLRRVGRRSGDGWQAVRLDFVGGRMAMALVLPDGAVTDLEQTLDHRMIADLLGPYDPVGSLQVQVPKWTFRSRRTLNEDLAALGMPAAFDRDAADFSGMTGDEPLAISTVVQEAFVAVDEEGAEAAAATGIVAVRTAALARPQTMIFDRPFLFLIFDRQTGLPVFIGRVSDPRRT
ncbi:serpin family protein [Microlunatus sp. Gsoil 973]|uniref:serpin family protein n=1 Tax=Microlunatus sp. Gsoil 973 TaxID=2672569 RepID=UPI0018A85753|nr:serpin family protein [Microlunatus sp. Gsoil 973]